jgi:hypothetical protein
VFVDECKSKGYRIAAAAVMPSDIGAFDRALRRLTRPGQRRIHFTNESDASRRALISAVARLRICVVVYQVSGVSDRLARPLCLDALVDDLVGSEVGGLVLERDESVEAADRRIIADALRRRKNRSLHYVHANAHEQPQLWISDMVAWCCYKGGDWRRRVDGLITETRVLEA